MKRAAGRKGGGLAVVSVITSEPSNWVSRHSASVRSLAARFAAFSHPLSLSLSLSFSLRVILSLVRLASLRSVPPSPFIPRSLLSLSRRLVLCSCVCVCVCVCVFLRARVCSPSLCERRFESLYPRFGTFHTVLEAATGG